MNRKKITLVSAVIVVLIVGGASVAFLSPSLFRGLSMSKLTTEKKTEKLFDLDVFVVNLDERHARRYLRASLSLGLSTDKDKEEIKRSVASVRHSIIMLLSVQNAEDLSTPEGKEKLRAELLRRVNDAISKATVQNVYFKEFLIQ